MPTAARTAAEQRAEQENLPVLLLIPSELLRIAEGAPIIVSTTTGQDMLARLPTADEFIASVEQAGGSIDRAKAERIVRPVTIR